MTAVLINILLPLLALISLVAAFVYLFRALGQKRRIARQVYSVGQVEMRRAMKIGFLRAIIIAVVGAVLLVAWSILLSVNATAPIMSAEETPVPSPEFAATPTITPSLTPTEPRPSPSPTLDLLTTPTSTETAVPSPTSTITPTPEPTTATVSSGVGVWLRATPSTDGEQLEWVLDGTLVILLPGQETGEEFTWQQVRTPAGNEGWVAVPFLVYDGG